MSVFPLEMSLYWEFPWVPWESHGNGNSEANFIGMVMALWEWEGMKTLHFPISGQRKRTSPSVVLHQLLRELRRTVTHSTVIAHQLRSAMSLTLRMSVT